MKKYGKLIAFTVLAYFISAVPTFAKLYTVDEFGEKAEEIADKEDGYANYAYIIGDYAFTSVHTLTVPDIMLAARSIKLEEGKELKTDESDGYGDMAIHYLVNNGKGWKIDTNQVGSSKIDPEEKFNIVYIDYIPVVKDYIIDEVDPQVQVAVDTLNEKAEENGFEAITFDEETHTVTFKIHDLNKPLKDYAEQGVVELFEKVLTQSGLNTTSISYKTGKDSTETTVTADQLIQANIIKFALGVIESMTGKDASEAVNATYADVVGKSAEATFTFTYEGEVKTQVYKVQFTYDEEEAKDADLTKAANKLNEKAAEFGFESIVYTAEDNTVVFTIKDETKLLAEFATSGILDMFEQYITGATKVEYTIDRTTVTKDSIGTSKTDGQKLAAEILAKMAGVDVSQAPTLKLAQVAGKTATAKITFHVGGNEEKVITYTLKFAYDVEEVKNYELTEDAKELNKEAEKYGFNSIVYDSEIKTVTFDIKDDTALLATFAETDIVKMFENFAINANTVTYKIGNNAAVTETLNGGMDDAKVIGFAKKLLSQMAGVSEDEAANITLAQVGGKTADATFVYIIDGKTTTITYHLNFAYNLEKVKEEALVKDAKNLSETVKADSKYGFSDVTYDPETRTATFKILNNNTKLVDFATSGIIPMFMSLINNATKAEYTIGEKTTTVDFSDAENNVLKFAAELLLQMAGKEYTNENLVTEAMKLTLNDVKGKTQKATITYMNGDTPVTLEYTLVFEDCAPEEEDTIPETFKVNDEYEFSITTKANGTEMLVKGIGSITKNGVEATKDTDFVLYYWEDTKNEWLPLVEDFGPVGGFPLMDATSKFKVKFLTEGTYHVSFKIVKVDDEEYVVVSEEKDITVTKAE